MYPLFLQIEQEPVLLGNDILLTSGERYECHTGSIDILVGAQPAFTCSELSPILDNRLLLVFISSQKALANHRGGSLIVTILAKFDDIIGVFQKLLLTAHNRMISADYVMPLCVSSLLANIASPCLSDSRHFIPSLPADQVTRPGR